MPRLLLLGSAPAHLALLEGWGRRHPPAAEVTLVAPTATVLHPAMVPGIVEGRYRLEDAAIDLAAVARQAGAEFLLGAPGRVDQARQEVQLEDGRSLPFDIASLALDGLLQGHAFPGVAAYAAEGRTEPELARLLDRLDRLAAEVRPEPKRLVVAGATDRGVELALAARARLDAREANAVIISLFDGRGDLFGGRLPARADLVERVLAERDISLRLGTAVAEVGPDFARLSDGRVQPADLVIWSPEPAPPPLFRESALPVDARGRLRLDDTLQVQGAAALFGAEGGVTLPGAPLPPGGPAAARVLAGNLAAVLRGRPPSRRYRAGPGWSLLDTGQGRGIVFAGPLVLEARWAARLKSRLERRAVNQLRGTGAGGSP